MKKRFYQTILVVLCLMGLSSAVYGQDVEERINKLEERVSSLEQMVLTLNKTNMDLTQEIVALKASDSKSNLNSPLSPTTDVGASKSFHTPEAAIEYFIECVNNEDYDCALRACAVDEIVAGYDYEAMINRLRAMQPIGYLPSEYEMYAMYNKSWAEFQILRQLSWMTLSVILPEKYEAFVEGKAVFNIDFDGVVDDMDPEKMQDIEIVEIGKSDLLDKERTQENFERQAKIWGANDMTMRAVLYDIDGDYYVGGFQLLEYNGSWLITALNDILIGQSVFGTLVKVNSKTEFRAMLKQ